MVMLLIIAFITKFWWLLLILFIAIPFLYGFIKPQVEAAQQEAFRAMINEKAKERLQKDKSQETNTEHK